MLSHLKSWFLLPLLPPPPQLSVLLLTNLACFTIKRTNIDFLYQLLKIDVPHPHSPKTIRPMALRTKRYSLPHSRSILCALRWQYSQRSCFNSLSIMSEECWTE